MGISDRTTADLTLYAESDGSISVDTGSRYVAVGGEDLGGRAVSPRRGGR